MAKIGAREFKVVISKHQGSVTESDYQNRQFENALRKLGFKPRPVMIERRGQVIPGLMSGKEPDE